MAHRARRRAPRAGSRRRRSGSDVRCSGRTLMATGRSRRLSRARYTTPMRPSPGRLPLVVLEARPITHRNRTRTGRRMVAARRRSREIRGPEHRPVRNLTLSRGARVAKIGVAPPTAHTPLWDRTRRPPRDRSLVSAGLPGIGLVRNCPARANGIARAPPCRWRGISRRPACLGRNPRTTFDRSWA